MAFFYSLNNGHGSYLLPINLQLVVSILEASIRSVVVQMKDSQYASFGPGFY